MYDITSVIMRGLGGPHFGHEQLMREALKNTKIGGVFVLFLGTAQARPEPSNPFPWYLRQAPFKACIRRLAKEVKKQGVFVKIVPLRDFGDNLRWANKVYTHLLSFAKLFNHDASKIAIVDANKNGDLSNYHQWFKGKLEVLQVELILNLHAADIRRQFFVENCNPENIYGLTPEAVDFLTSWKKLKPEDFQWIKEEFLFVEGFGRPLPKLARAVVCRGNSILLFQRKSHPGLNQFDIPTNYSDSGRVYSSKEGYNIYYPGFHELLPEQILKDCKFKKSAVLGLQPIILYDADPNRISNFFGSENGWDKFANISSLSERVALLKTPLSETAYGTLNNIRPTAYTPEWVEFESLAKTQFFRRETVLYLELVLGEIPVEFIEGSFPCSASSN